MWLAASSTVSKLNTQPFPPAAGPGELEEQQMTIRTILITALTSTALVGFSISANAQTATYNADDPFFGNGGLATSATAYIEAVETQNAAYTERDNAKTEWDAAKQAIDDAGDEVPLELYAAENQAEAKYNAAAELAIEAEIARNDAYTDYFNGSVNGANQVANDLRGENGMGCCKTSNR